MIYKYFNKTLAIFLAIIFIFGLFPPIVFSQPYPVVPNSGTSNISSPFGEIKGFNRAVFDNHFSRADREINPERWLSEAKLGITQAINVWELVSGNLYENPLHFYEAKNQLLNWSNEELEKRFSQWLKGRFFGSATESTINNLIQLLVGIQTNYLWHLDDKGNIIYDDNTGNPLIIRPDDIGREFSQDLIKWRNEANESIKTTSTSFNNILIHLYPELLAYLPDELRENIKLIIEDTSISINTSIKTEFENITAREERKFTSRRTRDILSLRKKSEDEAAKKFTEYLIAEAEEACKNGINEIKSRIEQAEAGTGDLALLGKEWLQLYKEQFDRGLKAWEEAEERFFIRRIEWEQESIRLFSEGNKIWQDAFNQFEEQRNKWELDAKELFNTGAKLFEKISFDFKKNIEDARNEFELNMNMRIREGETKVKALVDMYLISASTSISSFENVEFLHYRYFESNTINPKDTEYNTWLIEEIKKTNNPILIEIKKAYDMYTSYREKALEARDRILADYAALLGSGALKDILSPDASSEDFFLDEYQLALIRAKALVLYWEKKTSIAEAVFAYAGELSAGRMTEAESLRAWEEAKTSYNNSLAEYETELNKLNKIGEDLQKQQEILKTLTIKLQEEEEKLNKLYSDYSALVSVSIINREDYYKSYLNSIYKIFIKEYLIFQKTENDSIYKHALENGLAWSISEIRESAEIFMNILINGDGADIISLPELLLSDSEIDIKIRLAAIDLFADDFGSLRSLDSEYSGADWYSKAKGISLSEKEKAAIFGDKLYAQLYQDYEKSLNLLFEKRLDIELNALFVFINETINTEEAGATLSEDFIAELESAEILYEILLALQERYNKGESLYVDNNFENYIIDEFISGLSWFTENDQYLINYHNDVYYCYSLLEIFNNNAQYSSFMQKENWQNSLSELSILLNDYNINSSITFLPDVQILIEAIKNKSGDFIQNTSQFLLDFDSCFSSAPYWIISEINNWKQAIIEYTAIYAININFKAEKDSDALELEHKELIDKLLFIYENTNSENYTENIEYLTEIHKNTFLLDFQLQIIKLLENYFALSEENEKHWREYLSDEYIKDVDPVFTLVKTWEKGALEDALFKAVFYTNRTNEAFIMFSDKNITLQYSTAELYNNYYSDASINILQRLNSLENQFKEITYAGKAHDYSKLSIKEVEEQLLAQEITLKTQEEIYNKQRAEYFQEAEHFIYIGSLYDKQYSILKKAYENTDQKCFEYEKQDAVKRWASTSYLNINNTDIDDCKAKLSRAETVLNVLSCLYNEENNRTYNDPQYEELYTAYKQIFKTKLIILEAVDITATNTANEYLNNENFYYNYYNSLNQLGYLDQNYLNYTSGTVQSKWTVKDIIMVKDGRLVFSADQDSLKLTGIDKTKADELNAYFTRSIQLEDERVKISAYEEALRGLSERMSEYFKDKKKFKQWSLARDYLLYSLINANKDIKDLKGYYNGIGELSGDGTIGRKNIKTSPLIFTSDINSLISDYDKIKNNKKYYTAAWNSLSDAERADLEFYVIITLQDNTYSRGFNKYHTLDTYQIAYSEVKSYYNTANEKLNNWFFALIHFACKEMRDISKNALNIINSGIIDLKNQINDWEKNLTAYLSNIEAIASEYKTSCNILNTMEGIGNNSKDIEWDDINSALKYEMKDEDIDELKKYWNTMKKNSTDTYKSVEQAVLAMKQHVINEEDYIKMSLKSLWLIAENNQITNENIFFSEVDSYINGTINIEKLKTSAEKAYGENAASVKSHLNNMHTVILNNLSTYLEIDANFYYVFSSLGEEITLLTSQTLKNKYLAELTARETEWKQQWKDITEKKAEWQKSANLIIEAGRTDWIKSKEKMEKAYEQWNINFISEYNRIENEWNIAYLASLEDKKKWIQQAADAANNASSTSFLSLIGTEGERLSRVMDTREPLGISYEAPEAQKLMSELLMSSGIINMSNAFNSLNSTTGSVSINIKRGMGGTSTWDAAIVKTAASDLARKTNEELANMEARRLANKVRLDADEAIKGLTAQVDIANKNFKSSMDNQFISTGLWTKKGSNYVKEVVKGSTLISPLITETAIIKGYIDYIMEPITLKTNLDETYLASLDTLTIRGLLDNAILEIDTFAKDIFGKDNETAKEIKVKNKKNERKQSPGKFGAHIGFSPDMKADKIGETKASMFHDKGAGELGRMMTDYIYWSVIEGKGNEEIATAPWDKRIWNDDGSWFQSPSLRTVGTIAGSIAASVVASASGIFTGGAGFIAGAALIVAISSFSEVALGALDLSFNFKSIEEVSVNVGKTILINSATSLIGGVFSGFGGSSILSQGLTQNVVGLSTNPIYQVAAQTVMTGVQTTTTTLASTAISGIYYHEGELKYNTNVFNDDYWNGLLASTLTSMTGTFVSTGLTAINSGLDLSKLKGFNNLNKEDLSRLNNLAGSLAGQGVNYAMGNDFTLNLLNMSLLTNGEVKGGLLELHLGRDGTSMNFGMSGANISFDNLIASFNGTLVWNVNSRIGKYINDENNEFKKAIALRAQYGYGGDEQKKMLYEILDGKTIIKTDTEGEFAAQTTRDENGRKIIYLTNNQQELNVKEQFLLAVILGHESYRDGYVTDNNYQETRTATVGHTEMALRMIYGGETVAYNQNLANDISNYLNATSTNNMSSFNTYIDNNYDSSADYWKLVIGGDNIGRFMWDGEYTFDLSAIGIAGRVNSLDDDALNTMWKLGHTDKSFDDFATTVGLFYTLNNASIAFETALKVEPKFTISQGEYNEYWTTFTNALLNAGSSGLFAKKDAIIMPLGGGPNIFANGQGEITSFSGLRAVTWGDNFGEFQLHTAWDVGARGPNNTRNNEDTRLVAPMDGTLAFEFTQKYGLRLITSGGQNESITYSHASGLSIKNFIDLYSYNGVNLNNANQLTGIQQNMVIGIMGNTGTLSQDPHVDIIYKVNNVMKNPSLFFNENNYTSTDYAKYMSGFSGTDKNNVTVSHSQIFFMYKYLQREFPNSSKDVLLRFSTYFAWKTYTDMIVQSYCE